MKTVKVPLIEALDSLDSQQLVKLLQEKAEYQSVDQLNWESFPYRPICNFYIARSETSLYIRYIVSGNCLRAENSKDQEPVWQDSCVEFFVKVPGDEHYFNFEFNCIGTSLAARRLSRSESEYLSPDLMAKIARYPSIPRRPFCEMEGMFKWELTVVIPFEVIGLDANKLPESINANFYKCADATALPHYLSWNPINTPTPDFHRPEYFGELKLV
ncbi:MAG: carbohydrate-binding family 9-like protein [Bacteroidales bacterium]